MNILPDELLARQPLAHRVAPNRQLEDEELAGLGEDDGGLGGDHPDVLVGLHDPLDSREGEVVVVLELLLGADLKGPHLGLFRLPKTRENGIHGGGVVCLSLVREVGGELDRLPLWLLVQFLLF